MEPIGRVIRPCDVDVDLADRVQNLQPSDFALFYRRSWVEVYKPLAATLRDPELAREAVDEAMVRAYARWSEVSGTTNAEGWVYRVAYRWAVDRLRRQRNERRLISRLVVRPGEVVATVEPNLPGALATLPIEQRAVVVLACAFDWSETEIANALGIRQGTVKSRLHRGLKRLREELGV